MTGLVYVVLRMEARVNISQALCLLSCKSLPTKLQALYQPSHIPKQMQVFFQTVDSHPVLNGFDFWASVFHG